MHLYQGTTQQFIADATQARLAKPRDVLQPSRQVERYQRYLLDTHPAFSDEPAIALDARAYLHYAQRDPKSPLYHADFALMLDMGELPAKPHLGPRWWSLPTRKETGRRQSPSVHRSRGFSTRAYPALWVVAARI